MEGVRVVGSLRIGGQLLSSISTEEGTAVIEAWVGEGIDEGRLDRTGSVSSRLLDLGGVFSTMSERIEEVG